MRMTKRVVSFALVSSLVGAGAWLALGAAESATDEREPPKIGLSCAAPPEFLLNGGDADGGSRINWKGAVGKPVDVYADVTASLRKATITDVTLIASSADSEGAPGPLADGKGVLASKVVGVAGGHLEFVGGAPGRYPVWLLARYTSCSGAPGIVADPMGFVEVTQ